MSSLSLQFGITFQDLHTPRGVARVQEAFCHYVGETDPHLLMAYQNRLQHPQDDGPLLLAMAPILEDFIGALFQITPSLVALQNQKGLHGLLFACKRQFLQRRVARSIPDLLSQLGDVAGLRQSLEGLFQEPFSDLAYATHVMQWLQDPQAHGDLLQLCAIYGAWALGTPEGRLFHGGSALFHLPQKIDFDALIPSPIPLKDRSGFALTDEGLSAAQAADQAQACLVCHDRAKDSCRTGMKDQQNPLGRDLEGCPLEQKISEMNALKQQGYSVGTLAVITIDNPMVAATGHRICQDCRAACIFQTQEPIDIPGVETQILQEVLGLPWGLEIYDLLTRWTPLKFHQPLPKMPQGGRVLVVGMGPAGFTLAHYLLQEGHTVVGIDGLKIEPLPPAWLTAPIERSETVMVPLDQRIVGGFGGVAEYGITARWNKNYLTVLRIILERHPAFLLKGGVRFGSTITPAQAFESYGFDHVALCTGAGKPMLLPVKNALVPGVRMASDFLMGLQLTGASQDTSIANLDVRLPAVVIGGGLTAIDTAMEVMAYYPVQVEKFLRRFETLGQDLDAYGYSAQERAIAEEWLQHGRALRLERAKSQPNVIGLLQQWGGVKVMYRKALKASPGYRLNHHEVFKALQEGILFGGETDLVEIQVDEYGHLRGVVTQAQEDVQDVPARSLFVAIGTEANTVLASEYPEIFSVSQGYYTPVPRISFLGDLDPAYKGSVVKAMASAKRLAPQVSASLTPRDEATRDAFLKGLQAALTARVVAVNRLTPRIVEILVNAPAAVANFKPGQFYRLQNFVSGAVVVSGTLLAFEGIAATGAYVDEKREVISLIILEMGGSSSVCALLKVDEEVVLMGPTGTPTEVPSTPEHICLVGGGLGNAVLMSIGTAFKQAGHRVTYVAGYKTPADVFYPERIEEAATDVVWMYDAAPEAETVPFQKGTVIDGLQTLDLTSIDRFMVIGSDGMMGAVAAFLKGQPLKKSVTLMASINSPMQCMMKEICGQCLQRQTDPVTGLERYVYSCAQQDQDMRWVDFDHLRGRLGQNKVSETMTARWIERCLTVINE